MPTPTTRATRAIPDQGANRLTTTFRDGGRPVAAAPTAPRAVKAHADKRRAVVEWEAPADGAVSAYRVTVVGTGRVLEAAADRRSLVVDGLEPGSEVRFGVSAAGGATAVTDPVWLAARLTAATATATPTPTPVPTAQPSATPAPPATGGGGPTTTPKPTISFRGTPTKVKLTRKNTFVLRFKATPGLRQHVHGHAGQARRAEDAQGPLHGRPRGQRQGHASHRPRPQAPCETADQRDRRRRARDVLLHLALTPE